MDLEALKQKQMVLIYVTTIDCNVCKIIYPRVEELMSHYKKCELIRIEMDQHPDAAAQLMTFTVPAILLYSEGKELYKAARFINVEKVSTILDKYYKLIF